VNFEATRVVQCPACGVEAQGGKFCQACGGSLVPKTECQRCGSKLTPGVKFCPECGQKS
jgi:predicted amidophosphoribosyltransferase